MFPHIACFSKKWNPVFIFWKVPFQDVYGPPWLKIHVRFCKLKFEEEQRLRALSRSHKDYTIYRDYITRLRDCPKKPTHEQLMIELPCLIGMCSSEDCPLKAEDVDFSQGDCLVMYLLVVENPVIVRCAVRGYGWTATIRHNRTAHQLVSLRLNS